MDTDLRDDLPDGIDRPTLLLVEDEPLITELIEVNLRDAGFDVVAIGDAGHAIDELERQPNRFCGLITDIRMAGGNGWDIARRARELSPGLPVVYITGDSYGEWTSMGVPNSLLIEKPFAPAQIVVAIANLINAGQAPDRN
jgi:DNA-binding response OmpR family regulator